MLNRQKNHLFSVALLLIWFLAAFAWVWFARALDWHIGDWPLNFWMAAQGSVLIFLGLTILNAWYFNRHEKEAPEAEEQAASDTTP